jgi:hypothetical protein
MKNYILPIPDYIYATLDLFIQRGISATITSLKVKECIFLMEGIAITIERKSSTSISKFPLNVNDALLGMYLQVDHLREDKTIN